MNSILLQPTDVLFFRDGRPMSGSLSGHGAAWPLPNVISHAFHAALHRAEFTGCHAHRSGKSGNYTDQRDRKFGSLNTAGPFPVCTKGAAHTWFFPRPLDLVIHKPVVPAIWEYFCDDCAFSRDNSVRSANFRMSVSLRPVNSSGASNLPAPLKYAVGNQKPPSKDSQFAWCSEGAWSAYLGTEPRDPLAARPFFKHDRDFSDSETTIGIGIDPDLGCVADQKIYSASYLRLRDGWSLGALATAPDKSFEHSNGSNDLVHALLDDGAILVGGQQRVCTAERDASITGRLPLPLGKSAVFNAHDGKVLVKWTLLTPAIFPQINSHPGGWLPSWIHQETGQVMLLDGPGKNAAKRKRVPVGQPIKATLVAAITGKPLVVTGWALPNDSDRSAGGAKSTHLAVPAGSVYYFECDDAAAAAHLANALNWHGLSSGTEIQNRRSTLMGEKGFGLGVCSSWSM